MNEVLAAAEAAKETLSPEVMAFARTLHAAHGQHLADTKQLGQKTKKAGAPQLQAHLTATRAAVAQPLGAGQAVEGETEVNLADTRSR